MSVIQGEPGTGKTVIAIYMLKLLVDIQQAPPAEEFDSDSLFAEFFVGEYAASESAVGTRSQVLPNGANSGRLRRLRHALAQEDRISRMTSKPRLFTLLLLAVGSGAAGGAIITFTSSMEYQLALPSGSVYMPLALFNGAFGAVAGALVGLGAGIGAIVALTAIGRGKVKTVRKRALMSGLGAALGAVVLLVAIYGPMTAWNLSVPVLSLLGAATGIYATVAVRTCLRRSDRSVA